MQLQSITTDSTTSRLRNIVKISNLGRIHIIVSLKAMEF